MGVSLNTTLFDLSSVVNTEYFASLDSTPTLFEWNADGLLCLLNNSLGFLRPTELFLVPLLDFCLTSLDLTLIIR